MFCTDASLFVDCHTWLLSEEIDILPFLLLPLAGPEQFEEKEMEKLPEDLQYLPDEKQRELDPDIRKILLEALMKVRVVIHTWVARTCRFSWQFSFAVPSMDESFSERSKCT